MNGPISFVMTLQDALDRLKALGSEKMRDQNRRHGSGDNQFGVRMGDIRSLAKEIKLDPALAAELWSTGNIDAQFLSILICCPKLLSREDLGRMARSVDFAPVADWLSSYVVKQHPEKETLREKWMIDSHPMVARLGWSLCAERVIKNPEGLDLGLLLDRIEREMPDAPEAVQWTMNYCLAETGIRYPEHRERAVALGEKIGAFRDYPTAKGCVSPFAPIWIAEMVRRSQVDS